LIEPKRKRCTVLQLVILRAARNPTQKVGAGRLVNSRTGPTRRELESQGILWSCHKQQQEEAKKVAVPLFPAKQETGVIVELTLIVGQGFVEQERIPAALFKISTVAFPSVI
jgi:hypothetical protein